MSLSKKREPIRFKAIRGAWAVARAKGIEPPVHSLGTPGDFIGLMSNNEKVRLAMVAAWEAGYRRGRAACPIQVPRGMGRPA